MPKATSNKTVLIIFSERELLYVVVRPSVVCL